MKIPFLDMDGVLVDFWGGCNTNRAQCKRMGVEPPEMFEKGFFRNLKPNEGSKEFVELIEKKHANDFELHIASKPSTKNLWGATEKFQWVEEHFPSLLRHRTHLIQDKGLLRGHYLVDDYREKWEPVFKGKFIWFDELKPRESWENVYNILMEDLRSEKDSDLSGQL